MSPSLICEHTRPKGYKTFEGIPDHGFEEKHFNHRLIDCYDMLYWLVVWLPSILFSHILGISSSQLTKSYFSEGFFPGPPTSHSFNTTKSCKQRNESYDSDDLGVSLRRSFPEGFFDRVPIYPLGLIDFIPLISM